MNHHFWLVYFAPGSESSFVLVCYLWIGKSPLNKPHLIFFIAAGICSSLFIIIFFAHLLGGRGISEKWVLKTSHWTLSKLAVAFFQGCLPGPITKWPKRRDAFWLRCHLLWGHWFAHFQCCLKRLMNNLSPRCACMGKGWWLVYAKQSFWP